MPDARKSLDQLRGEWESCTRCSLGEQRNNKQGAFVFGQGRPRSIMFIGEGPGEDEEEKGVPFIGRSGDLLRSILHRMGVTNFYLSNLVACRSCEPILDENNMPRFRKRKFGPAIPMFRDMPPLPTQWKACKPRLEEEIYLVDPVIIVSLGGTAAEGMTGEHITITRDRNTVLTIEVPGAGYVAQLTEKKQVWYRKVNGEIVAPVEQATVRYSMIPTLHPAYVLRKIADQGHNSPFRQLVEDIRKAVKIYEFYMKEVHGQVPTGVSDASYEEVSNYYLSGDGT
jgi:uracil-DNA glycosylase